MRKLLFLLALLFPFYIQGQSTYFQQDVNYRINIELNDSLHLLSGNIQIDYTNNSQNSLDTIWILLMPNAYKDDNTALAEQLLNRGETTFYFSNEKQRGFIDSLDFKVDSKEIVWKFSEKHSDICFLLLNKPLKKGETIRIESPFRVKIPAAGISRMGHNEQIYQISQWYPKPAVYDQYGWHPMPYLDKGEFYSEFGSFDVFIRLPKNYVVAATGDLVDNNAELEWLEQKSKEPFSALTNRLQNSISSSKQIKTLHFHQEKVHDFAWFASKEYYYRKGIVSLKSGKKVISQIYFLPQKTDLWENSINIANKSVKYLSEKIGEYPYNQVSVVQGDIAAGGGMEYPTITVIGENNDKTSLEQTIVHEIAHNWFYGILGFNERDNPWMDEGLTTFYESLYSAHYSSKENIENPFGLPDIFMKTFNLNNLDIYFYTYLFLQSRGLDQKCLSPSNELSDMNYAAITYYKTSLAFNYLYDYLGEEKFDSIMRSFYSEWKFKHPQPADFKSFFEEKSLKNLDWFFNDIIGSTKGNDYSIRSIRKVSSDSVQITIINKGGINAPIQIRAIDKNGLIKYNEWSDGFYGKKKFKIQNHENLSKIELDSKCQSLDINISNQQVKTSGLFKSLPKLSVKLLYSTPKIGQKDIFYFPIVGYNLSDKFMFGTIVYNDILIEKKWEYRIMPLWSFDKEKILGEFGFYHNLHHLPFNIRKMSIGLIGKKYGFSDYTLKRLEYQKIMPEICIYFKSPHDNTKIIRNLKISFPIIYKENFTFVKIDSAHYTKNKIIENYSISRLQFEYKNTRKINPYKIEFDGQIHSDFIKFCLDARYRLVYKNEKSGLDIRFFIGKILNSKNSNIDYYLKMGHESPFQDYISGMDDYLFENTNLSRGGIEEGLISHSTFLSEGGFSIPTFVGKSANWLTSINLKSSIGAINFMKVYLNAGTYYNAKNAFTGSQQLMYEGGVLFTIVKDVCEVYVPLVFSSDIKQVLENNNNNTFNYKIRFTLKLESANPFKYLKELNL